MKKELLFFGIILVLLAPAFAEEVNVASELEILENHIHNFEVWFGRSNLVPFDDWANQSLIPFNCTTGVGYFGDTTKVIGHYDMLTWNRTYDWGDFHRMMIESVSDDVVFKVRFIWSGTSAEAGEIGGNYTDVIVKFDSATPTQTAGEPIEIMTPLISLKQGLNIWARCWAETDTQTIDFFVGTHVYKNNSYTSDITADIINANYDINGQIGLIIIAGVLMFLGINFKNKYGKYISILFMIFSLIWIFVGSSAVSSTWNATVSDTTTYENATISLGIYTLWIPSVFIVVLFIYFLLQELNKYVKK